MDKTLNEIMQMAGLRDVSKMIYSYLCLSSDNNYLIIGTQGFSKMYKATVTSKDAITEEECFDELVKGGLLTQKCIEHGEVIYELYKPKI